MASSGRPEPTVIADHVSLNALPPFPGKRGVGPLLLHAATGPADQVESVTRRLNRYYFACGCLEGSTALAGSLVLWAIFAVAKGSGAGRFLADHFAVIIASLVAAAAGGKVAGLVWAWLHYRRARRDAEFLLRS
jgi:hypothetical protein